MNKWNKKGLEHGYCKFKYANRKVGYKCTYNNGILLGYEKWYDVNGNGKIRFKQIDI
tara:strand:+ start:1578 stop:1748 length:171 start_codon:yes stop_codon:yes gene_type:complete